MQELAIGDTGGQVAEGGEAGAEEDLDHAHGQVGSIGEAGSRISRITSD